MFKWLAVTAATAIALPLGLLFVAAAVPAIGSAAGIYAGGPSALALADIPASYLAWYMNAAQTCPGLPWAVLAGIGKAESDHGRSHASGCIRARTLRAPRGRCNFCRPRSRSTRSTATTTVGWISMTRRMRSSRRRRCCAPPPANTPNSGSPPPAHSSAGSPPTAATPPRSPNPTSTPGTPPTASTSGRERVGRRRFRPVLPQPPRRPAAAVRRLGLHPGTDIDAYAAAALDSASLAAPAAPLARRRACPSRASRCHRHRHRLAAPGPHAREGIGRCHLLDGRRGEGAAALREALAIYQRIGSPNAQRVERPRVTTAYDPQPSMTGQT